MDDLAPVIFSWIVIAAVVYWWTIGSPWLYWHEYGWTHRGQLPRHPLAPWKRGYLRDRTTK